MFTQVVLPDVCGADARRPVHGFICAYAVCSLAANQRRPAALWNLSFVEQQINEVTD